MKNHANRRLLMFLMLCILFCLALGGAAAEECSHEEMEFTPNATSDVLTQSCAACGHYAELTMPLLVVAEGQAYTYSPTIDENWDGPVEGVIYCSAKSTPYEQLNVLDQLPSAPGTYYVTPYYVFSSANQQAVSPRVPRVFGQLVIISKDHTHSFSYTASGNVITAACNTCGPLGTLTLDMYSANAGEALPAVLTQSGIWPDDQSPVAAYYAEDGSPLSALPQEAGNYYAAVNVNGAIAVKDFTISDIAVELTDFPAERLIISAPARMEFAKQTLADGQYHMVISKEATDWSASLLNSMNPPQENSHGKRPSSCPLKGRMVSPASRLNLKI